MRVAGRFCATVDRSPSTARVVARQWDGNGSRRPTTPPNTRQISPIPIQLPDLTSATFYPLPGEENAGETRGGLAYNRGRA